MTAMTKRDPFPTIYSERCHNDECARMADWWRRMKSVQDEIALEMKMRSGTYDEASLRDIHNGLSDCMSEARGSVELMEDRVGRDADVWFE